MTGLLWEFCRRDPDEYARAKRNIAERQREWLARLERAVRAEGGQGPPPAAAPGRGDVETLGREVLMDLLAPDIARLVAELMEQRQ